MAAKNILYVFDETAEGPYLPHHDRENNKIFLCPLTVDQENIKETIKKLRREIKAEIILLHFSRLLNEKAFSIRKEYIQFIAEIAEKKIINGKNLKEYLKLPFKDFSAWWFSLTAEKNTLRIDDTFGKLTKFLTILDIQERYPCHEIWMDVDDKELTHSIMSYEKINGFTSKDFRHHNKKPDIIIILSNLISTIIYFFILITRVINTKRKMRGLNLRRKILKDSQFLLVTYFPLLDERELKNKKFVNKYYQPLQGSLEKKYRDRFIWMGLIVDADGFNRNKSVALGRQINKWGYPIYFSEEWLTFGDLFIAFLQFSYISLKFLMKVPQISREFKYPPERKIWPIFKNEWYSSFIGPRSLFNGLIFYRLFNNVFRHLKDGTIITYLTEMYAWEKALNIAAKERGGLKVIGVQHTTVPLLALNHFNHGSELRNGDNIHTMPTPNYLACVGEIPRELFIESGWDKNKVFILGAIRFEHYKECLKNNVPWNRRKNKVIVALTISPEESKELLLFVYYAYKRQKKYQVIIKGHPFCPVQPLVDSLGIKLDKDIFEITEIPISELIITAKAMVVTGSSVSLEAIACQCPVIIPRLPDIVDMNPLSGISRLPIYVDSPETLIEVTDEIIESEKSPLDYEKCKNFILSYCDFSSSGAELLGKIEKLK